MLSSMIRQRPLFAEHHCWFVLVGTLDLLLTKVILSLGGRELNPLADLVLRQFDTPGLAALKYSTIIIVVLTFAALLPMFLGLLIVLPVLGHATWHLYKRLIAPEGA